MKKNTMIILISFICLVSLPRAAFGLNLDEAISLAKKNLPAYQGAQKKVQSSEALYNATLAPYLPSLDASASRERHERTQKDFNSTGYDLTMSYKLFDGGKRKASRDIARLDLDTNREVLRQTLIELEYNVKVAFYTALAGKEIVDHRKVQLEDAKKDHEVAEGRNRLGAAKLSEVLQASVRLEQARYNLILAEGNFRKALAELYSLIGKPFDATERIEGILAMEPVSPDKGLLSDAVLLRPEVKQAENALERAKSAKSLTTSDFFPVLSADLSYSRSDASTMGGSYIEDKSAGITATWNIFELGKFYKTKSSKLEITVSEENLKEMKRLLLLDLDKNYEDLLTAQRKLAVASQQLKQAEQNYLQAFGEYKVGKGDILSLVQAESLLAGAREQLTASKLNLILSKSLLERIAGIENLEAITRQRGGTP